MHITTTHRIMSLIAAGLTIIGQTCATATEAIPPKTGEQAKATKALDLAATDKLKEPDVFIIPTKTMEIMTFSAGEISQLEHLAVPSDWKLTKSKTDGGLTMLTGVNVLIPEKSQITKVGKTPRGDLIFLTGANTGYRLTRDAMEQQLDGNASKWEIGDKLMIGTLPIPKASAPTSASAKTLDDLLIDAKIPATTNSGS